MSTDYRALRDKLIRCRWVTNFNADTLVRLIEKHYAAPTEPEGPSEDDLTQLLFDSFRGPIEFICDAEEEAHLMIRSHVKFARAVLAKWGRPTPQPVAVSERLPGPSVKVLAHYFNALGKSRTICAIWVPAKSRNDEGGLDADDFLEYDEENDKYYWPEGWYEAIENWEELGWAKVYEGEVTHWQPLPQWPANALLTPEALND